METFELKDHIRGLVQEQVETSTKVDNTKTSATKSRLQEALTSTLGEDVATEVLEGYEESLTEGLIDSVIQRGLERYPMMFLERGDQRYFFVKSNTGVDWVFFKGETLEDHGSFDNNDAGENFIYERQTEGFKAIKRDGGIKKFLKSIGRGISVLMKVGGAVFLISAIVSLIYAFLFAVPAAVGSTFIAATAINGALSLTAIGGGWIIGKISKKKADME